MRARLALTVILAACLAIQAFAHRLNEYLQATTLDVSRDHIALSLRLTPGVDVAKKVIAGIDTDGDSLLSGLEKEAYAEQVRKDLSLTLDGKPLDLRLISATYPSIAAMMKGSGDIVLAFDAKTPNGGASHEIAFENHHLPGIAAYLVNCLRPQDLGVQVVGQIRNVSQSFYRLDYREGAPTHAPAPSVETRELVGGGNVWPLVQTYVAHGIHHILTGYDHLLFIAALVLGASTLWDLVKVVTAFTVAHSITLTLAALNLVHLSERIVEPLISASIVFVAVQNIFWPDKSRGASRLAVAFFFGLFHGLGFAGGLIELMHQMPIGTVLLAILGFSIGVEVGNQMVLLPLFGFLMAVRYTQKDMALKKRLSRAFQQFGSASVSLAGVYYLCLALTGHS